MLAELQSVPGGLKLQLASGWGFIGRPPGVIAMADEDEFPAEQSDDGLIMLSAEEAALAQLLGELREGDWARVLFRLSVGAKDEIRSAIGELQARASFKEGGEPE